MHRSFSSLTGYGVLALSAVGGALLTPSSASAAINVNGTWAGYDFQYATVWLNGDFTPAPGADNYVGYPDAYSSQDLNSVYGPTDGVAGSAHSITSFNLVEEVITGSGTVSATGNLTMGDAFSVALYFETEVSQVIHMSISGTAANNIGAPPAYFYVADATDPFVPVPVPQLDFTGDIPALNGSFSASHNYLLPAGSYVLYAELVVQSDESNTATGSYSFAFSVPEPTAPTVASIGLAALAQRRRKRSI